MNARHIIHIREALWKRPQRGACVMVGAGLSRQAGPAHPTDARPPSWGELAKLLQKELGCGKPDSGPNSPTESVTARDCSRLAQQYKATFGQSALDSFLLAHVPDGEPGQVHQRLLAAPVQPDDPDDEIFLLCALDGNADYLVSEDDDLLSLRNHYARPSIVNCEEALTAL